MYKWVNNPTPTTGFHIIIHLCKICISVCSSLQNLLMIVLTDTLWIRCLLFTTLTVQCSLLYAVYIVFYVYTITIIQATLRMAATQYLKSYVFLSPLLYLILSLPLSLSLSLSHVCPLEVRQQPLWSMMVD